MNRSKTIKIIKETIAIIVGTLIILSTVVTIAFVLFRYYVMGYP